MTDTRHLHKDNDTTYCGLDAATILMTFDPGETTCELCLEAAEKALAEQMAEEQRLREEEEARIAAREAEDEAERAAYEEEQAQIEAEEEARRAAEKERLATLEERLAALERLVQP